MKSTRFGVATCSYELDDRLVIRNLGPGWNETAIENEASELLSPAPVGQPLLMFLTDATTVQLYELLFERVMVARKSITFPIRCDAPHLRRYLNVTLSSKPTGGYIVSTLLTRSELRPHVALLAPDAPRRKDAVTVCSWCKRANVEGNWVEVEKAITLLRLFESREQPRVTHGICDACHRFMLTMLADDSKLPSR